MHAGKEVIRVLKNEAGILLLLLLLFKHGQPVGSFRCERINTAKQKDGFTSFLVLSVLEVKIFQYQVS